MKELSNSGTGIESVKKNVFAFEKVPMKDRSKAIMATAKKLAEAPDIMGLMEGVAYGFGLFTDKNKDKKAMGSYFLTSLNSCFENQEVYVRTIYPEDVRQEEGFRLTLNALDSVPQPLKENPEDYYTQWPHLIYLYTSAISVCNGAIETCLKVDKFANLAFGSIGGLIQGEFKQIQNDHIQKYSDIQSRFKAHDKKRVTDHLRPIHRERYVEVINELDAMSFPPEKGLTHPMDIQWGGISLHEIQQLPKGAERYDAVLNYCADIPKGDVFWRDLSASTFFTEVTTHNPEDRFEEIAQDFQLYIGTHFINGLFKQHKKDPHNFNKIFAKFDQESFIKLGLAIAHFLVPPSGKAEDVQLETGIGMLDEKSLLSLSPYVRNLVTYLNLIPKVGIQTAAERNTPAGMIEKAVTLSMHAARNQQDAITGLDNTLQMDRQLDAITQLGPRAQIIRADALIGYMDMKIDEVDFVIPETQILSRLGFKKLTVSKEKDDDSLNLRLLTKKQAIVTAELTPEATIENCSWILPDHEKTIEMVTDMAILSLVCDTSTKDAESAMRYSQGVLLDAYGIPMSEGMAWSPSNPASSDVREKIEELEGMNLQSIFKRRPLLRPLLRALLPESASSTVNLGQEAIFDLMQKAKKKGEIK